MSTRPAVPAVLASAFALLFFGLGNYLAARQSAESDGRIAALRAEIDLMRREKTPTATGTSGGTSNVPAPAMDIESWDLVVSLTDDLGWDDVQQVARPKVGVADAVIDELSPQEQAAFVKLLKREMGGLE